jgi:hypothetical protein
MDGPVWIRRRCGDQIGMKQVVAVAFQIRQSILSETGAQLPAVRALTLNPRFPTVYYNMLPRCCICCVYCQEIG